MQLDIILIVLGLVIIAGSYVISEKVEGGLHKKNTKEGQIALWTEKDERKVREHIDRLVEERVEQAIDKTENELSRISNEKIITSNEFSEQILGKIEKNHEEVVFLYNMLQEKEKQMKSLMREIETLKTTAEEKLVSEKEQAKAVVRPVRQMTGVDRLTKMNQTAAKSPEPVNASQAAKLKQMNREEKEVSRMPLREPEQPRPEKESIPAKQMEPIKKATEERKNRNREILALSKKGMSVLEISRALNMGQGEVKLIIDLFQGADR